MARFRPMARRDASIDLLAQVPLFSACSKKELQAIAKRSGSFTAYVIEVCPACSWNHLARTFLLSPAKRRAAAN